MPNDPRDEYGRNPAFWLAEVLVRIRKDAGEPGPPVPRRKVAELLDVDQSTLQRLETGVADKDNSDRRTFTFKPGFERYLAGYAQIAGIADPRTILLDAIQLWIRDGSPPSATKDLLDEAERAANAVDQRLGHKSKQHGAGTNGRMSSRRRSQPRKP